MQESGPVGNWGEEKGGAEKAYEGADGVLVHKIGMGGSKPYESHEISLLSSKKFSLA